MGERSNRAGWGPIREVDPGRIVFLAAGIAVTAWIWMRVARSLVLSRTCDASSICF